MIRYRNIILTTILFALTAVLNGCFTTELVAPDEKQVNVLSANDTVNYRKEYRNWYILWGAVPLYTTQPEELIIENNLTESRVQTEDTITDGIISFFSLSLTILPQTVIVEGNTNKRSTNR